MIKQILLPLTFLLISFCATAQTDNRWQIEKLDNRLGFIDSKGTEVYVGKYSMLGKEYNSGLVSFIKGDNYGFLDTLGNVVFNTNKYHGDFSEGLLNVNMENKFYYLNTKGKTEISLDSLEMPQGKEIYRTFRFTDGLGMVIIRDIGFSGSHDIADDIIVSEYINMYPNNWFYGFIDESGKWKIKPELSSATVFQDGISLVVKDSTSYFMDTSGELITQIYDHTGEIWTEVGSDAFDYSEGFAKIYENDSATFINKHGKIITPLRFQRANNFSDGMASVQLDNNWGFIDTTGQLIIKPKYYLRSNYSEGLAPVLINIKEEGYAFGSYGKSGFINKKGEVIIPFKPHVSYAGFINGLTKGRRSILKNKKYTGKYELFYMKPDGEIVWSEIVD